MEGFTKEVLMTWKVLVVEGGRCIVPRAGKKGIDPGVKSHRWLVWVFADAREKPFSCNLFVFFARGDRRFEKPGRKEPGWCLILLLET